MALAATAAVLLAAPLAIETAAPSEVPDRVAVSSAAPAPVVRSDERPSASSPLRSGWARPGGAAPPASDCCSAISAQRAAASSLAHGRQKRWLLSHATTTSLP